MKSAEVLSDVFDPNVFRVALTLIAVVYLIHGERHHARWLVVMVFGGAVLGLALKEIIGRARPVLPDPVSMAPGMSFPSGHAVGASTGCCLLLLIASPLLLARRPRGAVIAAVVIVGIVALARVMLGVHFVSDVLAGFHHARRRLGGRDDVGLRRMAGARPGNRSSGRPMGETPSDPVARRSPIGFPIRSHES